MKKRGFYQSLCRYCNKPIRFVKSARTGKPVPCNLEVEKIENCWPPTCVLDSLGRYFDLARGVRPSGLVHVVHPSVCKRAPKDRKPVASDFRATFKGGEDYTRPCKRCGLKPVLPSSGICKKCTSKELWGE